MGLQKIIGLHTKDLFNKNSFPFWIGLLLVVVLPFLSTWRVEPLNSFYIESISLIGILLLVLITLFTGSLKAAIPRVSWYFWTLAVFWAVQARVMHLDYVGLSDMAAWSFVIMGLGTWAVQSWVERLGLDKALSLLAFALLIGCFLQSVIGWLQYTGLATHFSGLLVYHKGVVEGQLAQRNHLGHYLMWGVLAVAWLGAQRRLSVWFCAVLIAFFASVMALTGSRTILAYVLAIVLLLPLVGILSGSLRSRTTIAFFGATMMVLLLQFALDPLLSLFQSDVNSAVERISNSTFGTSGRSYEWQKAWQVFLSAPFFGHGWNSYSLQGFLTNVYQIGFRPYEGDVLFTHSHNFVLNLLAEMGLVGTFLVLVGLLLSVSGCLKRANNQAGLFILALLTVSLVHSLLEYPLWYVYFLSVFALIMGFAPQVSQQERLPALKAWQKWGVLAGVLVIMVGIIRLGFVYHRLAVITNSNDTSIEQEAKDIVELVYIAKTEPMLRYYAQFELMPFFEPKDKHLPEWASEASQAMKFRPYANAYKWSLIAARTGQEKEAKEWMQKIYQYYPAKINAYGSAIVTHPSYDVLYEDYRTYCHTLSTQLKLPIQCIEKNIENEKK